MTELFLLLFGIATVLLIITVVGHGLWLALAWFFRLIFGVGRASAAGQWNCPRCGATLSARDASCARCGWPRATSPSTAGPLADLKAAARQIERFRASGAIEPAICERVLHAITAEEQRITAPPRTAPATPAAAPPAPPIMLPPAPAMPPFAVPVENLNGYSLAPPSEPAASVPPAERVHAVMDRMKASETVQPVIAAQPAPAPHPARPLSLGEPQQFLPPASPRRPFSEMLAAFMEEKNIRWGEVVGGLLIIGCSIALVFSLWATIEKIEILKFFLFTGVTSAIFGVGLYTEHRWKLPTTSRGVLIIATLLVPLNFLAIGAFSKIPQPHTTPADSGGVAASKSPDAEPRVAAEPPADWQVLLGEAVAFVAFFWLVQRAGQVIVPGWSWILTTGVLGASLAQLLIRRFTDTETALSLLFAFGALPLVFYGGTTGWMLRRTRGWKAVGEAEANLIFILLGSVTFAVLLAFGLLIYNSGRPFETLRDLAPLVSLGGVPALASGLVLWRRLADANLAGVRTAGTSIAVLGAVVLLAGIGMAWPNPSGMLPVALLDFAALTAVALLFELPAAHVLATPCLVLAYLIGVHLVLPESDSHPLVTWRMMSGTMFHALVSAPSGTALVGMIVALGLGAEMLRRAGRQLDARFYQIVTAATGVVSLALVTWFGFGRQGDPHWAAAIYAIYAAAAYFGAWRTKLPAVTWVGSGLALAAIVQAVVFRLAVQPDLFRGHQDPYYWQLALLVFATLAVLTAAAVRAVAEVETSRPKPTGPAWDELLGVRRPDPSDSLDLKRLFADPLSLFGLVISLVTIPFWLYAAPSETTTVFAEYTFWLAAVWFAISYLHRLAGLFTAAQVMLTLGVLSAVTSRLETRDWYAASPYPLVDPWTLEAQGIALALLGLAWVGARIGLRRYAPGAFGFPLGSPYSSAPTLGTQHSVPSTQYSVRDSGLAAIDNPQSAISVQQAHTTDRSPPAPSPAPPTTSSGWRGVISWLLYPPWPPFDRMVIGLIVLSFVAMAIYGATPGILQELAARDAMEMPVWNTEVIPHTRVMSVWSWALMALLVFVQFSAMWERFEQWLVLGILAVLAAGGPLVAMSWESQVATASALRWLMACFLAVASLPILFRARLRQLVTPLGWPELEKRTAGLARDTRTLLLILTITPVLALTLYPAAATIAGDPVVSVAANSVFGRMGDSISYVVPLALVCLSLVGHAIRERSSAFAFSAGLVLNLTVTLGYLLAVVTGGGEIRSVEWIRLLQLNAIAASGFALLWLASRGWLLRLFTGDEPVPAGWLLKTQVALGLVINLVILVPAELRLFFVPHTIDQVIVERGSVLGWLAVVVSAAAVAWLEKSKDVRPSAGLIFACLLTMGSLVTFTACNWDAGYVATRSRTLGIAPSVPWLGYHTLLVSRAIAAWVVLAIGWWSVRSALSTELARGNSQRLDWRVAIAQWTSIAAVLAIILALWDAVWMRDVDRAWWSGGTLVAMSVLMAGLARWTTGRGYLYWSGILFNLATSIWWMIEWWPVRRSPIEFIEVNVIALALPAIAWLRFELDVFRRDAAERRVGLPAFHHVAAIGSIVGMSGVIGIGLFADAIGHPADPSVMLGWTALASCAAILLACMWDVRARYAIAGLYVVGMLAVGMTVDLFDLEPKRLGWTGTIILAAYSVATSYLWSQRGRLQSLADSIGMPRREESPLAGQAWLLVANQLLATVVVVLSYWIVLSFDDYTLRITAAKAAIVQALAIGLLAQGTRRTQMQKVSLALVAIGAVAWGWAWLEPGTTGNLLNRAVVVLTVLAAITAIYGLGLGKFFPRETEWTRAAKDLVPSLLVLAGSSLAFVLGTEVYESVQAGIVEISSAAIAAVIAALAGLCVAGVVAAVVPGRDPLSLSDRGRMMYVYGAELLAGLLFMHVRLTMPWLFHGWFTRYWPLIVVALAFLGVGLSEIFRRQNRLVLAEPLERTGTFLPVLPVLGFWALYYNTHFSLVLLPVGVLYGFLSVTRKSFGFGVLASIAANGGLVYLLQHNFGYALFEHAQIWLIPGALCVLAAAYLNREQLTPQQFVAVRYITMMIIYVSSTADIFLTGVREAPWLPMVLALFSVAGIFAGIMLRVRAFLFLGVSFLVLSLVTMIVSAQLNLGWYWAKWLAGVALGVAVLVVFALFEKKRTEMLQVVERLKQWEK